MSRAVYLVCKQCRAPGLEDYSDSINNGEKELRAMWETRELVAAIYKSEVWSFDDVRCGFSRGDWFRWIAAHSAHAVELRDEYGGVASLAGEARCERPAST